MAVRINGTGDYLRRTANLPSSTAFTLMGWAHRVSAQNGAYRYFGAVENATSSASQYLVIGWSNGNNFQTSSSAGGGAGNNFASAPAVGTSFAWAITCSGTGGSAFVGYWRAEGANTWTTVSGTGVSFTPAVVSIGNDSYDEWTDMRFWNVKCWDRALTADELLAESFYRAVKYPTSLNFHWPYPTASAAVDISGNGRNATIGATPATEDDGWQPWKPGALVFVPQASAPPTFLAAWARGSNYVIGAGAR